MKVAKIILALSVVWSGFGFAELYAERGTVAGGMPLAELDPDVRVPEALEVPIPPPPGAKFISGGGDKHCVMGLRTKLPVKEVCDYYESKLTPMGYSQVDAPGLNSEGCQIYKEGDMLTEIGVMVEKVEDPMFVENGSTLVLVNYLKAGKKSC